MFALLTRAASTGAATNGFAVVNSGTSAYVINGVNNPNLKLVRGFTYSFAINTTSIATPEDSILFFRITQALP